MAEMSRMCLAEERSEMTLHVLQLYIDPPHQFNWQYPMAPYSESPTIYVSMELHNVRHAEL